MKYCYVSQWVWFICCLFSVNLLHAEDSQNHRQDFQVVLYGPETFLSSPHPQFLIRSFDIARISGPYHLIIEKSVIDHDHDHDHDKEHFDWHDRSHGCPQISLNGKRLDFEKCLHSGQRVVYDVHLQLHNVLQIRVVADMKSQFQISVVGTKASLPPPPESILPPQNPSVPMATSQLFNYFINGTNKSQMGVVSGAIDPKRIALIHGYVRDQNLHGIANVKVFYPQNPNLGFTLTATDGSYSFISNGGGETILQFSRSGYLPLQRRIATISKDYNTMDDAVLTALDPVATNVVMNSNTMTVVKSSVRTDSSGSRSATILFPKNTMATVLSRTGVPTTAGSLTIRATEFTVGANGLAAMPATLPGTTAYTYAVEFSADEALPGDVSRIVFNQDLPVYVNNFIRLPVGTVIPSGYYDLDQARWLSSKNGKVIRILGRQNNLALIDSSGTGQADNSATLTALGITDDERQALASNYVNGTTLWRVPISHFTSYDFNLPYSELNNYSENSPDPNIATNDVPDSNQCEECLKAARQSGSIIEVPTKSVGESIPITGTNLTLNYSSKSTNAYLLNNTISMPLIGSTFPAAIQTAGYRVLVAGREFSSGDVPATPNLTLKFAWDGKDAYGRDVFGPVQATVKYIYKIAADYNAPPDEPYVFGAPGGVTFNPPIPTRSEGYTLSQRQVVLGNFDARSMGLGGWMLSNNHHYDFVSKTIFFGDGTTQKGQPYAYNVSQVRGFAHAVAVTADVDGTPLVLDQSSADSGNLFRVAADGTLTSIVWGLNHPQDAIVATNGDIYIAEPNRILRIQGGVSSVIVSEQDVGTINKVAVMPGGAVYFLAGNSPNNLLLYSVNTPPEAPAYYYPVSNIPMRSITYNATAGLLASDNSGNIYACQSLCSLYFPTVNSNALNGMMQAAQGLFLIDSHNLYKRTNNGTVMIAGGGIQPSGAGYEVAFNNLIGVAATASQALYVLDGNELVKIVPTLPFDSSSLGASITIAVGRLLYDFDSNGAHVSTRSADNGKVLTTFTYNSNGQLLTSTDQFGQVTTIRRDSNGHATAIVSPYGDVTSLTVSNLQLAAITDPAGNVDQFQYSGPLLTSRVDKEGNTTQLIYDSQGNFQQEIYLNEGITKTVSFPSTNNIQDPVTFTSGAGRNTVYSSFVNGLGQWSFNTQMPDGSIYSSSTTPQGDAVSTSADGSVVTTKMASDPFLGPQVNYVARESTRMPSGLERVITKNRIYTPTSGSDYTMEEDTVVNTNPPSISKYTSSANKWEYTSTFGVRRNLTLNANNLPAIDELVGLNATQFTYDSLGRMIQIAQADRVTSVAYNAKGQVQSIKNAEGQTRSFIYDSLGRLAQTILPDGRVIGDGYSPLGNLLSVQIPGKTQPAKFTYNRFGDELSFNHMGATTSYAYDKDRILTSIRKPDSTQIIMANDAASGKLKTMTTSTDRFDYSYDATSGKLSSVTKTNLLTNQNVTNTFSYDGEFLAEIDWSGQMTGRLERHYSQDFLSGDTYQLIQGPFPNPPMPSGSNQYDFGNSYDTDGRPQGTVRYGATYDNRNLMLNENWDLLKFHFIDGELLADQEWPEVGGQGSYTYNNFGEVTGYQFVPSNQTTAIDTFSLTRDRLGRITSKTENIAGTNITWNYQYDVSGRLSLVKKNGVSFEQYNYDKNSNRLSKVTPTGTTTATFDTQDRMLTSGVFNYTYTANGERKTKRNTLTNELTQYSYDGLGNLTKVILPNGTTIDYIYDAIGNRVAKDKNGTRLESYIYDDKARIIAYFKVGGLSNFYNYVSPTQRTPGRIVTFISADTAVMAMLVRDERGSPRLIVDGETGNVIGQMDYDDFGFMTKNTNPGFQPFGFAGGLYDPETGLTHFGARDYDAETGKWLSKDPIEFKGGDMNLSGYVAQDPVNFTDPNGTGPITGGSVCAALEGANALYNTGKFIIDNNNLTNEYTDKINKLKGDGSNTCPEIEAQISQLQLDFINKQKALLQSYLTPNLGRQGLIGAACITALLSPSP